MSTEVKVPDIGDAKDVEVVEVLIQKGSKVLKEDPLITLESDKASMDVPSPIAGVVASVALKKGDRVSAGALIASIDEGEAKGSQEAKPASQAEPAAKSEAPKASAREAPPAAEPKQERA